MSSLEDPELQPLITPTSQQLDVLPSRSVEDDVLPETSTLGRTLTWQSAYILVISRVIGSGIFATPGAILRSVGSPGLSLSLWIVGAIIAACGLMISLEFGSMLPRSGGDKVYLEFTYRRPRFLASTLIAVQAVLLGFTASNCIVFSEYLLFALGGENPSDFLRKGIAVALLTLVTLIHGCFPRFGIKLQNFLGWIKVALIIFMIMSGLYVVLFRPTPESAQKTTGVLGWGDLWEDTNWNWGVIATSLFKVFYSYAGLDNANYVLNEVKDPVRTLRSVTMAALTTACGLYALINVAYFLVVPIDEIKQSGELIAALFFERIFGAGVGKTILPLAVALSAGANVLVVAFSAARTKQEIARQGFLPFSDILSSTKPFNSPLGGLFVHYIPSFLVITLPPSRDVYSFILEVEGYPGQILALAIGAGLLWLRFKRPDIKRPFKAWVPAVVLRIGLSMALLAAPFFPPDTKPPNGLFYATYAIIGVSIIIAGVIYWYIWTVLLPRCGGYQIEEKEEILSDGTTITKLTYDRPFQAHSVIISDLTGDEERFSLDRNGFQIYRSQSTEKQFQDDDQIKSSYYAEVEELLKDVTGASRVFIFDHTIRRQPPGSATQERAGRGPVQRVHIDQSYKAALSRVPHHLPEDANHLLKGRVQIINVWRPIKTVQRDPLAFAEAGSVSESDLVVTELIYPNRRGETYAVRHNTNHMWYYKHGLTPDEVILIKCFDSKTDGRARRVPHTAFVDPTASPDAPPRESIEVRALVFHPEDQE
ncbi:amino acid permease-domain-containing protein [Colletotrichum godetiae]|uniref:Amino acid permease-domain-containing protein n=1 Tax=Colletotrichum godetiae TaxID=1209918 RepID=A0AAJ0A591_9PEZI|nr:amino acid permease-domain-containing protein [Colletotrichum godetiae]KAK1656705.1 amino acid permease-domain-containing protein [Colletotrichum godetiae]